MARCPAWLLDPDGSSLWEGTGRAGGWGGTADGTADGTVPDGSGEDGPGVLGVGGTVPDGTAGPPGSPRRGPITGPTPPLPASGAELGSATLDLDWLDEPAPGRAAPVGLPPRYRWLGVLGAGGMGEVHRVDDTTLGRVVALKFVQGARWSAAARAAFREEARLTASLQHPGIVPVHDLGDLPDGRSFYTMPVVPGESLAARIAGAHHDGPPTAPVRRQLVDLVLRACEAVAHAHERGIVHRDLKPANIMVGGPGQVRVLDWGLGTRGGRSPGAVAGTPSWMAPEQAAGTEVGVATDVWALGAILAATHLGRSPFPARDLVSARARLLGAPVVPQCPHSDAESIALWEIVEGCLQPAVAARFADAGTIARALADWRDGVERRRRAMGAVERARGLQRQVRAARAEADKLQEVLDGDPERAHSADPDVLAEVWEVEDRRDAARRRAAELDGRMVSTLRDALQAAPDLRSAQQLLADHAQHQHAEAEAAGMTAEAQRWEAELRRWDAGAHRDWLSGTALLTLRTEPPGARVRARRLVERGRRLVPEEERALGQTPLIGVRMERGHWVLELDHPGREPVRVPLHLRRGEHLGEGSDPAGQPIPLPRAGALGSDGVYLPPGWATVGGAEPLVDRPLPRRRLFFPGLVAQRHPLRHRDLLAWWQAERSQGRGDEAQVHLPRLGPQSVDPAYAIDEHGAAVIVPDEDGDCWDPDWPAFLLRWDDAMAIAASMRERSGRPWRLPGELEWERMARGPAGSVFPWGTAQVSPAWCHMRGSPSGHLPAPVGQHPLDRSVFGVCGLAGNVMEWCAEDYPETTPVDRSGRVVHHAFGAEGSGSLKNARGGAFGFPTRSCRSTVRRMLTRSSRYYNLGMRLVRDLVPADLHPEPSSR